MSVEFLPSRIKTLRELHSITLDQMATKLGKPKQLVSIWENGVNIPTLENLLLICNTFDVPPAFFLSDACDTVDGTPQA